MTPFVLRDHLDFIEAMLRDAIDDGYGAQHLAKVILPRLQQLRTDIDEECLSYEAQLSELENMLNLRTLGRL
jgi:hypothetical protein